MAIIDVSHMQHQYLCSVVLELVPVAYEICCCCPISRYRESLVSESSYAYVLRVSYVVLCISFNVLKETVRLIWDFLNCYSILIEIIFECLNFKPFA